MAIPIPPNTTCDIYRTGTAPPAAPAVAAAPCFLNSNYVLGLERDEGGAVTKKCSHAMLVDFATDIRDAWDNEIVGTTADTVYIPDKSGTAYKVVYVEMRSLGTPSAFKFVFLARLPPTWPSNQV